MVYSLYHFSSYYFIDPVGMKSSSGFKLVFYRLKMLFKKKNLREKAGI